MCTKALIKFSEKCLGQFRKILHAVADMVIYCGGYNFVSAPWILVPVQNAGDSGTVTSPLIPWNLCGAFISAALGVPCFTDLPFARFCWICLLIAVLRGFLGKFQWKTGDIPSKKVYADVEESAEAEHKLLFIHYLLRGYTAQQIMPASHINSKPRFRPAACMDKKPVQFFADAREGFRRCRRISMQLFRPCPFCIKA